MKIQHDISLPHCFQFNIRVPDFKDTSASKGGRIFFYVSHLHGPIKQGRSVEIKKIK